MGQEFEHVRHEGNINVYIKGGDFIGSVRCIYRKEWSAFDVNSTFKGVGTKKECVDLVKSEYLWKAGLE